MIRRDMGIFQTVVTMMLEFLGEVEDNLQSL